MQLKVRQRATDHAVGDTRPNHRQDGGYSQQVYGMGEDKTTSSSGGSDKGGRKLGIYRVRDRKIQPFSSFKHQYHEKGSRCGQSYY